MKTVHLLISGKVQGVFYRASAKDEAESLSIKGWIRNTENGAVEATVTGSEEAIERFINWCKQGPSQARVDEVAVTQKPDEGFREFKIIRGN